MRKPQPAGVWSARGWPGASRSGQHGRRARSTPELLALEMVSERLVDDLGKSQVVEVCLASDGFDPSRSI